MLQRKRDRIYGVVMIQSSEVSDNAITRRIESGINSYVPRYGVNYIVMSSYHVLYTWPAGLVTGVFFFSFISTSCEFWWGGGE